MKPSLEGGPTKAKGVPSPREVRLTPQYFSVCLLSVVGKAFEKVVSDGLVDHLEKCGFLSDFQYGARSSQSIGDLFTVLSGRIARTFNRSKPT